MFVLVLNNFVSSIFVPYAATAGSTINIINTSEMINYSKYYGKVIGLGFKSIQENPKQYKQFHKMAELVNGEGTFFEIETKSAYDLAIKYGVDLPCIFFCDGGYLIACYNFPDEENTFSFLIDFFVYQNYPVASSVNELNQMIGNIPLTIITTKNNLKKTKRLVYASSTTIGPINIVLAIPDVFFSLGFNPNKTILYRKQDSAMVVAEETVEKLSKQIEPSYYILSSSLKRPNNKTIFALTAPSLTNDYADFLYELGNENPDFCVAFVQNDKLKEVFPEFVFDTKNIHIVVMDSIRGYTYNSDEFFPKDLLKVFNMNKWTYQGCSLLEKIREGKTSRTFLTERIPQNITNNCYKIVGKTYEDFILDNEHDIVVLYINGTELFDSAFLEVFKNFSTECSNIGTLKFGYIDVIKNRPNVQYPFFPNLPHVQIFPALNKSNNDMMRGGKDRYSLMRAIKRVASFEVPFEPPLPDKAVVAADLVNLFFGPNVLPHIEYLKTKKYADEMDALFKEVENIQRAP